MAAALLQIAPFAPLVRSPQQKRFGFNSLIKSGTQRAQIERASAYVDPASQFRD
jgi:hypothetical protein